VTTISGRSSPETLAEQQRLHLNDIDAVILRTIGTILTSFGIEEEDRKEIRVLDYYESVGQVLAFHVNWLRSKGYANAILYLPHDGINANNITGKRYDEHLRDAGFSVEPPAKNQGKGAAMMRVEALRRLGPQIWWNESTTEPGRDAIGFYHEAQGRDAQCRARAGARLVEPRRRCARPDGDLLPAGADR